MILRVMKLQEEFRKKLFGAGGHGIWPIPGILWMHLVHVAISFLHTFERFPTFEKTFHKIVNLSEMNYSHVIHQAAQHAEYPGTKFARILLLFLLRNFCATFHPVISQVGHLSKFCTTPFTLFLDFVRMFCHVGG